MLKLNARTIYVFCMNSVTPEAVAAAGGEGGVPYKMCT